MNSQLLILLTLAPLFALAQTPPPIACPPSSSGVNIKAWRELAIGKIAEGTPQDVVTSIAQCFPTTVPKCLNETKNYAQEQITGEQPSATPTPLTLKSEKDLPPEFLPKDADGNVIPGQVKIPDNIFEIAAAKNWKVVDYKTRSTGGFDGSPNLVLVVLPNWPEAGKDVYLQISPPQDVNHPTNGALPKPEPRTTVGLDTLTVITADKTVNPPVGQLRLMNQPEDSLETNQSRYVWNDRLQARSCTACHSVPLRSISPRGYGHVNWELPMNDADQALVTEINGMMKIDNFSWGTDSAGFKLGARPDSHPYGWAPASSDTRSEAFIRTCFEERQGEDYFGFGNYQVRVDKNPEAQLEDWMKIKNAMNCVGCHDNKVRGYLHEGFSFDELVFKVLIDKSMPPDSDLTNDERLTVLTCIQKEHDLTNEAWRKTGSWLKKQSCGL
jgi:hypothetical protein